MEADAGLVREAQAGFIPGLLQAEGYIRAAYANASQPSTPKEIDTAVAVRKRRQERLTGENSLKLHAIIDEDVLRRELPADVMRDQLGYLVMTGELENVTIQVLPHSIGLHDGRYGNFIVLSFPDHEEPDVGYVEHVAGAVHIEKIAAVDACKVVFDDLAGKALSHDESIRLIDRLADQC
jgi:hypothetical protein